MSISKDSKFRPLLSIIGISKIDPGINSSSFITKAPHEFKFCSSPAGSESIISTAYWAMTVASNAEIELSCVTSAIEI